MKLLPIQIGRNLWTCSMECAHRQKTPHNGVALCLRNGRDHRLNAERGECPEGRFVSHQDAPVPVPVRGKGLDDKRETCAGCPGFGGFLETICGLEEDGPEVASCAACSCPLKKVNLRTGRCPRRLW
ncbi:MAG: hypothetical protein ACM359_12935 [Bacillota bacterium]